MIPAWKHSLVSDNYKRFSYQAKSLGRSGLCLQWT